MGKRYTKEEHQEALKLAEESGAAVGDQRGHAVRLARPRKGAGRDAGGRCGRAELGDESPSSKTAISSP